MKIKIESTKSKDNAVLQPQHTSKISKQELQAAQPKERFTFDEDGRVIVTTTKKAGNIAKKPKLRKGMSAEEVFHFVLAEEVPFLANWVNDRISHECLKTKDVYLRAADYLISMHGLDNLIIAVASNTGRPVLASYIAGIQKIDVAKTVRRVMRKELVRSISKKYKDLHGKAVSSAALTASSHATSISKQFAGTEDSNDQRQVKVERSKDKDESPIESFGKEGDLEDELQEHDFAFIMGEPED